MPCGPRGGTLTPRHDGVIVAAPGAALAGTVPLSGNEHPSFTAVSQDDLLAGNEQGIAASRVSVSPGYVRTIGMAALRDAISTDATR